ncbi:hypothetical protein EhV316 [Emiliania huxleyi virus 86]|uniref:Putative membrane protein n=1 Tax=Emiliania huxleyi virus 86 (isolate United Kingdom/English Channel/1999) TaxID=654925 RepID=Q4A2G3_EHV8U|nr:hypothetical protein EhV316 [Emiliania huxleyi virus 86]AEO97767.1 hypothetical protein ENVG_00234 [Emiliania huxleyi virus 84]AEP15245.1 hypothetical protein EOVG_00308 [Emiliania huxleyi virus 88]AEP15860.1 hypothetical protein EQVG_00452 [Emiliania huxleyi virus 207]AEP16312.1 hypothetical protein ERVG_00439 [Emiliania huxleyi virus 208]AET98027.1 hypothetical protein EPVG_00139 [Emiliania huxleyi virus 201]
MLTKLYLSSKFTQSYIAFHGITDAVKVYNNPQKIPSLILSYVIPQASIFITPVHVTHILFSIMSAYHFRHNIRSTAISFLFISVVSIFRLLPIIEVFLLYHSTVHYIEHWDIIKKNKVLFCSASALTYILIEIASIKQLIGIATGHILFNELKIQMHKDTGPGLT